MLATDGDGRPCVEVKTTRDIEQALAMPGGNIFHGPLSWPWAEDEPLERVGLQSDGPLADLRHLTRTEVAFSTQGQDPGVLTGVPGANDVRIDNGRVSFTIDSDRVTAVPPELARLEVTGLTIKPPSLEELFLRDYGDELAPAGTRGSREVRS